MSSTNPCSHAGTYTSLMYILSGDFWWTFGKYVRQEWELHQLKRAYSVRVQRTGLEEELQELRWTRFATKFRYFIQNGMPVCKPSLIVQYTLMKSVTTELLCSLLIHIMLENKRRREKRTDGELKVLGGELSDKCLYDGKLVILLVLYIWRTWQLQPQDEHPKLMTWVKRCLKRF